MLVMWINSLSHKNYPLFKQNNLVLGFAPRGNDNFRSNQEIALTHLSRRSFVRASACAAVAAGAHGRSAFAQDNTIKLIVSYAPGGIADTATRLVALRMAKSMGQPVVVENRPGASGRIGVQAMRHARADGQTLLMTNIATMVIGPAVWKTPGFDPVNDVIPVSHVLEYELAYSIAPNVPVKNLQEYAKWIASDPKNAVFGSPAIGGLAHFMGMQVGRALGVDLTHVGFRGSAPLNNDLMAGQIPAGIDTLDVQMRARNVRILGTTGSKRSPFLPNVPTFTELGYPGVQGTGWFGFFAAAKTPKKVVDRLSQEIASAVRDPEVAERLRNLTYVPTGSTSEEFAKVMEADRVKWTPLVKSSGLSLDE